MDYLSIKEKARWLSDLIARELQRFEKDTGVEVDEVRISRIDGNVTGVGVDIYRSLEHGRLR